SLLYPLRPGLERTALLLSPDDGSLHLRIAEARLGDLVHALRHGPQADAPGLAAALATQRSAAKKSGQDVRALDVAIRSDVPTALVGVPIVVVKEVERALPGLRRD